MRLIFNSVSTQEPVRSSCRGCPHRPFCHRWGQRPRRGPFSVLCNQVSHPLKLVLHIKAVAEMPSASNLNCLLTELTFGYCFLASPPCLLAHISSVRTRTTVMWYDATNEPSQRWPATVPEQRSLEYTPHLSEAICETLLEVEVLNAGASSGDAVSNTTNTQKSGILWCNIPRTWLLRHRA